MKILHLGKYYPPIYGGIESVTEALAVSHARDGHEVTVLSFAGKPGEETAADDLHIIRARELYVYKSQPLSPSYMLHALRLLRDADIVHVHAPNALAYLPLLLRRSRAKVVIHWHADISEKGMAGKIVGPLERKVLERSDAIVCTSDAYARSSSALAPFSDKISVIPIGIAEAAPECGEAGTPGEAPWPRPYILSVGRLVPYKGIEVLIDAARLCKSDVDFLVVGGGELAGSLKSSLAASGAGDRVHLLGRVDERRLAELYRGASLYCLPSINRKEAFGVVLLEAMRLGVPIVASEIEGSGAPWVNLHGVSGENVPVGDPAALACTIDGLMADPERRARYSAGGRARFLENFTEDRMCSRFLVLYRELLGR